MTITDTHNITQFVDHYLQVWNESDPDTRKELVRRLWGTDAVEYTNANEYRGHTSLDERVTNAHTQFVEEGGKVFRLKTEPVTHHGAVLIAVDMIPKEGGEPVWTGTIIALLGPDGRIEREYQFGRNL